MSVTSTITEQNLVEKELQVSFILRNMIDSQLCKTETNKISELHMRLSYMYEMVSLCYGVNANVTVCEITKSEHFIHNMHSRDGLLFCNIFEMSKKYPSLPIITFQYVSALWQEYYQAVHVLKHDYGYIAPQNISDEFSLVSIKHFTDTILILLHAASHVLIPIDMM